MPLDDIAVFKVLNAKLSYASSRQKLIAQNVANADTPGYAPQDLKPFSAEVRSFGSQMMRPASAGVSATRLGGLDMARTSGAHLVSAIAPGPTFRGQDAPDTEVQIDGNQVVLEDQMAKMTETRLDQEAALSFYQQSLTLLKDASKAPGK